MRRLWRICLGALGLLASACQATPAYLTARDANGNIRLDALQPSGAALTSYCNSILDVFYSTYVATHIATRTVPGYDGYGPTDSRGDLIGPVTSQRYWTSTYLYTEYPIEAYTAKPPCCSACHLSAGTMQLIYWPDQPSATSPANSSPRTVVNTDGFTMTSPSVYMAFSSLYASNKCGNVGQLWTSTTLAFDADEITTLNPSVTFTSTETCTVNGTETTSTIYSTTKPPNARLDYSHLMQNCSSIQGYTYWPDNPFNAGLGTYQKDDCHPILLLPKRLLSAQPAWISAGCRANPGSEGFYDPPSILATATSFDTPASTGAQSAETSAVSSVPALGLMISSSAYTGVAAAPASTQTSPQVKQTAAAAFSALATGIGIYASILPAIKPASSTGTSVQSGATALPETISAAGGVSLLGPNEGSGDPPGTGAQAGTSAQAGVQAVGTSVVSDPRTSGIAASIIAAMMGSLPSAHSAKQQTASKDLAAETGTSASSAQASSSRTATQTSSAQDNNTSPTGATSSTTFLSPSSYLVLFAMVAAVCDFG